METNKYKFNLENLNSLIESFRLKRLSKISCSSTFIDSEVYYVELDDGKTFRREKLIKNNSDGSAVLVIPVFENGDVLLCVEPRVFTKGGVGVGFPAGYVEDGEDYIEAGKRELLEESGITSSKVVDLGGHYQDSGISAAYNHILVAFDSKITDSQSLDESEFIKTYRCSLDEAFYLMEEGIISDANSVIALFRLKKYLEENEICLMQKNKQKK